MLRDRFGSGARGGGFSVLIASIPDPLG